MGDFFYNRSTPQAEMFIARKALLLGDKIRKYPSYHPIRCDPDTALFIPGGKMK